VTPALRYLLVIAGGVVGILLFLLASAAGNSEFFDQNYPWLLGLNAAVMVALLALVVTLLTRLYKRYRRGRFGSKLMARLVFLFAVVGILPGAVIYTVSVQFVSRSIESWFDVRVESALEAGLNLGRAALDTSLAELSTRARSLASDLADLPGSEQAVRLAALRDTGLEAVVVTANGHLVASVGGRFGMLLPDLPTPAMLQQARMSSSFSVIEGGPEPAGTGAETVPSSSLQLRTVVALPTDASPVASPYDQQFLQLVQTVPTQLATNAEALRVAYSEYQQRAVARTGLRKIYIVTLTLTLLLAIFAAIGSAFLIASDLAKPLLLLAEGTRAVAEGNFSPRPIVASNDELGTLTQSFNMMTRQLFDARAAVERNRAELQNAKAYLESVLANMSAGVIVLDEAFRLVTSNASAARILQQDAAAHIGQPLEAVPNLSSFSAAVTSAFSAHHAHSALKKGGSQHWQRQIEIPRTVQNTDRGAPGGIGEAGDTLTLLARGSRLPLQNRTGYVVVFDDISDVISAQRSVAWGEVARRLAHEIKNPLTPIQLSAERLQMKLEDKLPPTEANILNRSTSTIINQVSAMKRMVDDFRDYARTPPAALTLLDLNALISEILHLYQDDLERGVIRPSLQADLPEIMGDPTQLRQVIHNLLQNAQDAVADRPAPRIDVVTEAVRYTDSDGLERTAVRLSIADNGPGFAPRVMSRAFEPYVTSKPRGTGLGLAMVKKIVEEHGGRIDIENIPGANGAKVLILLLKLAE
jgi:nitrogen fixation/metabolism regulation signal transduction histidine kinase